MFLDVSLEFLVLFFNFFDGPVVEFVQFRLVVLLLIEIDLELLDLVFLGGLSRVVVLREGQHQVRVLLDHFRHLGGLGVLFAGERISVCVNQHFVVLTEVKAERACACHSEVSNESERRNSDLHEQVHDGLPDDFAVREFRVIEVAFDRHVELDFVVLVLQNVETDFHRDGVFRIDVVHLVANGDVVNVNRVLAVEVAVDNLVFAGECKCARLERVGGVVQRVVREVLEHEVFDADVDVHRV